MRPRPVAITALVLGLALVLPACGGDDTAATGIDSQGGGDARAGASASRQSLGGCSGQLGRFVTSLDRLRENLAVGLSYDAYLGEVEAAKATYGRVPVDRVGLDCLTLVGDPAERALNRYISGVNTWGDCLATSGCEPTSIEAELKIGWNRASAQVSEAQKGLRQLLPQTAAG